MGGNKKAHHLLAGLFGNVTTVSVVHIPYVELKCSTSHIKCHLTPTKGFTIRKIILVMVILLFYVPPQGVIEINNNSIIIH